MQDVPVLDEVLAALDPKASGLAARGLRTVLHVVVVANHLGANESLLKVAVNDPCGLGCSSSARNRPRTNLFHTGREVGVQLKQVVGLANQAVDTGLLELEVVEEHAALLVGFEFGDVGLGRGSQVKHARTFFCSHCAHLLNPGVSCLGRRLFDVAYVHHGLVSQKLVVGDPRIFFFSAVKSAN